MVFELYEILQVLIPHYMISEVVFSYIPMNELCRLNILERCKFTVSGRAKNPIYFTVETKNSELYIDELFKVDNYEQGMILLEEKLNSKILNIHESELRLSNLRSQSDILDSGGEIDEEFIFNRSEFEEPVWNVDENKENKIHKFFDVIDFYISCLKLPTKLVIYSSVDTITDSLIQLFYKPMYYNHDTNKLPFRLKEREIITFK